MASKPEEKTSKKRKRAKLKATTRAPNSVLSVPERFDLIGSQLTVADPGISINPDPQAQQDLLKRAYDIDLKENVERERLFRKFGTPQNKGEVKEVVDEEEGKESEEEKEEDGEARTLRSRVERRLTQAQRNKKKRKIERLELEKRKKAQKALKKQLQIIPEVLKTIDEEEKNTQMEHERLKEIKKHPDKPLRLGKSLIQKEFPEILLTEEVAGGHFRNIQPSVKLIKDQFKRFQERNLIEPRMKNRLKRRYKLKEYDRFKEPGESKIKNK